MIWSISYGPCYTVTVLRWTNLWFQLDPYFRLTSESDAQILAHFTVESPWETISPPLKKVLHPSKKIHWILSFPLKSERNMRVSFFALPSLWLQSIFCCNFKWIFMSWSRRFKIFSWDGLHPSWSHNGPVIKGISSGNK